METTEAFRGLACAACGETVEGIESGRCPACGGPLDPEYDAAVADRTAFEGAGGGSMWDTVDLLPFAAADAVSIGEGGTPLVEAPSLAAELGVGRVLVKDEGRNPTGTVLDRGLSVATTAAWALGVADVALASPGNGAQSAAAYAGRAGMESRAFVPARAAFSNKAMVNVHGGDMRVVGGRYPDALAAFEAEREEGWHSLAAFDTPYRHEGIKTAAYEILAALDWAVPDAAVVPTGSGEVLAGVEKGFRECRELGLVDDVPALYAAQPSGCAPVAAAWERGLDAPEPWTTPDTICGELEIPAPAGGELALSALAATDGGAVAVDDADVLESAVAVARGEGIEVGVAGGAAAAAAWKLAGGSDGETGEFDEDATIVVLNTEAGGKTPDVLRSHLMGQGI
ncbi:threonine synthase [Halegenticoccus tardaugens]|uniref:threonine synthase n=1 Tax=Halegenticoccus tardaugens TaxID=2071624 RepID=UPI00100AF186|nr:pyridoxal-phosphate dependent enzyme [Halegenticoccus tardaugens]